MMKASRLLTSALAFGAASVFAGAPAPVSSGKSPIEPVAAPESSFGRITLGGKFSEDLQSGYLDLIQGLVVDDHNALFLSMRGTLDDFDQQLFSVGLGYRTLIDDPNIILGANVFYDYLDSSNDNSFNQLGLGAEMLSKWVDLRFNYYLPESGRKETGTFVSTSSSTHLGPRYSNGSFINRDLIRDTTTTIGHTYEEGLRGWNAEIGFLVPGVEKYFDLRLFAGAYGYNNPGTGGDFNGFKARAEARVTKWLTLDLEYWNDRELVGGNWVAGFRVTSPFDLGKLVQGRNPFQGGASSGSRNLRDRMDEQIIRSHRIWSSNSAPQPGDSNSSTGSSNEGVGSQSSIPTPPTTSTTDTGGGEKPQPE